MHRRQFLRSIAAAAVLPAVTPACALSPRRSPRVRTDPNGILDLADGFEYSVVSHAGDIMSDGLRVPAAHDGMAAFERDDGRLAIVCNHEILAGWPERGAFGNDFAQISESMREKLYDRGGDRTPALGGTTTTIWNPASGETERQFLSLGGTEVNCAGGKTPWGSWLTCEEIFSSPGQEVINGTMISRDQRHGYVFEVPADADELVHAVPLRAMGRFEHEAAAVDPRDGVVYLTEDRHHSLLYRFVPNTPGQLADGGTLQALMLADTPSARTHNWSTTPDINVNEALEATWMTIDEPDAEENDLRLAWARAGAVTFARGEGICFAGDRVAFTATEGGASRGGQIFTYRPTSDDGGELELVAEVRDDSIMRHCDNITAAPWGDLICAEDRSRDSGIVGVREDGSMYRIAANTHSRSELAGVCFSPDESTLFVNIQYPGTTLAITGPWDEFT